MVAKVLIGVGGFVLGAGITSVVLNHNKVKLEEGREDVLNYIKNEQLLNWILQVEDVSLRKELLKEYNDILERLVNSNFYEFDYIRNSVKELLSKIEYDSDEVNEDLNFKEVDDTPDIENTKEDETEESKEEIEHGEEQKGEDEKEGEHEPETITELVKDIVKEVLKDDNDSKHVSSEIRNEDIHKDDVVDNRVRPVKTNKKKEEVLEETAATYEVDDERFSKLISNYITPLIEKYGDEFEDRLVKMADRMASNVMDSDTFNQYLFKLSKMIKYEKKDGRNTLNNIISNFFSIYPIDAK